MKANAWITIMPRNRLITTKTVAWAHQTVQAINIFIRKWKHLTLLFPVDLFLWTLMNQILMHIPTSTKTLNVIYLQYLIIFVYINLKNNYKAFLVGLWFILIYLFLRRIILFIFAWTLIFFFFTFITKFWNKNIVNVSNQQLFSDFVNIK